MTGWRVIYACPDCCGDLEEDGYDLWCPACERTVPAAMVSGPYDERDDDDHD